MYSEGNRTHVEQACSGGGQAEFYSNADITQMYSEGNRTHVEHACSGGGQAEFYSNADITDV
jgi:predicted nucleic-acid-binding Zn-ribbon protein